ncbi:hypothetical protein [Methanobrevibacter sp. DSM 116169]|uniref:hypothetical protein n=1 Tax=Methanobrevibacter sp. DSM 116169 TaxID=3242727 RepID=UPI0038FCE2E2
MKIKNIIAIIVIAVVVIAGGILAFDYFTEDLGIVNPKPTTDFDNNFMSGKIVGNAKRVEMNESEDSINKWLDSYKDSENNIEYNMSTCKNATFLIDYLSLQGMGKAEVREYGGNEWNIYFSQGVPNQGEGSNNTTNVTFDIYICESNINNQSYLVYIIETKTDGIAPKVESDGSLYCELFTDYAQPLLENAEFKHNDDAPEVYELLGISESDYTQLAEYIRQYKAGEIDANGNAISQ